jgi:hypothetical protein
MERREKAQRDGWKKDGRTESRQGRGRGRENTERLSNTDH